MPTPSYEPRRFRKKPVEIEAMQLGGSVNSARKCALWCGGDFAFDPKPSDPTDAYVSVRIPTLEGVMTASAGDWIIRGVQGEFYPCKPHIFAATYEAVQ